MLRIALITLFIAAIAVSLRYTEEIPSIMAFNGQNTQQSFYKWQDEQGQWHLSDTAPEGVQAIKVEIDTTANVLPSLQALEPEKSMAKASSVNKEPAPKPSLPLTLNPMQVPKLIDQAKDVERLMQERQNNLEKALQ